MDHQSPFQVSEPRPLALVPRRWLTVQACWRLALTVMSPIALVLILLLVLSLPSLPTQAAGAVRYVATGGGGACGVQPCYGTVQAAVDAAAEGDQVRVAQGVYTGVLPRGGFTQTVYISKSIALRGGYTTTDWANSYPLTRPTVLDAQGQGRVIYIASSVTATVEGFTITNGYISGSGGGGIYLVSGNSVIVNNRVYSNAVAVTGFGAGIFIGGGSPTVLANVIYSNTAEKRGGGIYIAGGSPTIESNQIYSNATTSGAFGGGDGGRGIYAGNSSARILGNAIYNNKSKDDCHGGGVFINGGQVVLERNSIHDNEAGHFVGGVYVESGIHTIRNNLIYNNHQVVAGDAGGIRCYNSNCTIENNTVYSNTGAGIYIYNNPSTLRNNIVVSNTTYGIRGHTGVTVTYNDASGNATNYSGVILGTGNMTETPQFESDGVDFRLKAISLLIDKADPNNFPSNDYDGFARPFGSGADMGAYEYHPASDCYAWLTSGRVFTNVQAAVDAATRPTDTVKVAGVCAGVQPVSLDGTITNTFTQTAYISKPLTLRGGYSETQWTTPMTLTVLDPQGQGRAIYISSTLPVTVDGLVIRGGNAGAGGGLNQGGGLYALSWAPFTLTLQNSIFYSNTAGAGGGLFAGNRVTARVLNNTFVTNTATSGSGGGLALDGAGYIRNSIVVSNAGGGVWARNMITPDMDYNDVFPASGYQGSAAQGSHDQTVDPRFVDFAGQDFHLRLDSPLLHAGANLPSVTTDVEGHARPLGRASDIGADEISPFPDVQMSGGQIGGVAPHVVGPGDTVVYTHAVTNTGSLASDQFRLSAALRDEFGLPIPPASGWSVTYDANPFELLQSASRWVTVAVQVGTVYSFTLAPLRVESVTNPQAFALAEDETQAQYRPGVALEPISYTQNLNPGTYITYFHVLRNLGALTDTFTLTPTVATHAYDKVIAVQTSPGPITLGRLATTTVWVSVLVDASSPGGLSQTAQMLATSRMSETFTARLTDTIFVNYVPGTRHVAGMYGGADDDLNNCRVPGRPCKTIAHALDQAANGDGVWVAGTAAYPYKEPELQLNKDVHLLGGHDRSFDPLKWNPSIYVTTLDGQGAHRVLNIFGSPSVEGFTIQNGAAQSGSGGAILIRLGHPTIRNNIIISNTAVGDGGAIYSTDMLSRTETPRIERNLLAYNRAQRGGGVATNVNSAQLWNNLLCGNTAAGEGGGLYVDSGSPLVWHDTFYGNTAATGGGAYLAGSSPWISNTIVAGNVASVTVGGVYSATGDARLAYNDVVSNTNGNYFGTAGGPSSFSIDPRFEDPANCLSVYGLRLLENSPLVDSTDYHADGSSLNDDYWGNLRPIQQPEVGADEYMLIRPLLTPMSMTWAYPGDVLAFTHLLTNAGNYTDTFTLVGISSQNWPVMWTPPLTVQLGVSATERITLVVNVPPTATWQTVDPVALRVTSGNDYRVFATATDTITVARTVVVTFTPDIEVMAPSGAQVVFMHTITNGGNYTDTFTITHTSLYEPNNPVGEWTATHAATVTLAAFTGTVQHVTVTVPSLSAFPPVWVDRIVLSATSQYSPTVSDVLTDAIYVNRTLGVNIEPDRQLQGPPGTVLGRTYWVTNTGNYTDSFVITSRSGMTGSTGACWGDASCAWPGTPLTITLVPPGQSRSVNVTITVASVLSSSVDVTYITATSVFSRAVADRVTVRTVVDPAPNHSFANTYPQGALGWCLDPGEYWFYGYELENTGNVTDTYDIELQPDADTTKINMTLAGPPWQEATIFASPQLTDVVGPLAPTWKAPVYVWIQSPTDSAWIPGGYDAHHVVTTTSRFPPTNMRSNSAYMTVVNYNNRFEWVEGGPQHVVAGRTDSYVRYLRHIGTETETVKISVETLGLPQGWDVQIAPGSAQLLPGQQLAVTVTAKVPTGVYAPSVRVTLLAEATARCLRKKTTDHYIETENVLLGPDHSLALPPGTVYTYTHTLLNAGVSQDSYDITYSPNPWLKAPITPITYTLLPGQSVSVTAVIQVPPLTDAQSISGTVNSLVITATSKGYPPLYDTAFNTTTVAYAPGAAWSQNPPRQVPAGQYEDYAHTLTNTGNYTQVFILTAAAQESFAYADIIAPPRAAETLSVTLAPGQVLTDVRVRVVLRESAPMFAVEDTSVFASFEGLQLQEVVHDYTRALPRPGPRFVSGNGSDLDGSNPCVDLIEAACRTVLHALAQSAPGDVIYVAQGVYTDALVITKTLSLLGGYAAGNWDAPPNPTVNRSVLDGEEGRRLIWISNNITATVSGFEIMHGYDATSGGGIYVASNQPVSLTANILHENIATQGGAVYHAGSGNLRFYNNWVYGNGKIGGGPVNVNEGAGLYVAAGTADVFNNTFVNNQVLNQGRALYIAGGTVTVKNNIFANHAGSGSTISGSTTGDYNDWFGNSDAAPVGWNPIRTVDPQFKNAGAADYHLSMDSPLINDGPPLTQFDRDVDSDLRSQQIPIRTPSDYDIGADEYAWQLGASLLPASNSRTTINSSVVYTHLLRHTGTWTDTFTLAYGVQSNGGTGTAIVSPSSLANLRPGDERVITVTFTWTAPAPNAWATVNLTATSAYSTAGLAFAADTTTYATLAALTIGKETTPNPVAGAPFTYTLTVVNGGSELATNLVVTDAVPANAYWVSGGTLADGVVSWPAIDSIGAGGTAPVTFVVSTCQLSAANVSYRVAGDGGVSAVGSTVNTTVSAPTITPDFTPLAATVNQPTTFTAITTTNGGPIVNWEWNWGDGITGTGQSLSKSYGTADNYTVVLTATDRCGYVGVVTRTVNVTTTPPSQRWFEVGPVSSPQYVSVGFTLVVTAYNGSSVDTGFQDTLALADSTGTLQPAQWNGTWQNGVATLLVSVQQPLTGDVITVTASSVSAHSEPFDVVWNPAGSVLLDVSPTTISVGATAHVTATVLDAGGNPVADGTPITFTATLGTIAPQVAPTTNGKATAVFTGTVPGIATITATLGSGAYGNATVTIVPTGQLARLDIGPVAQQYVGAGFTLVITAYDGTDNVLTSFSGSLALVDSTGTLQPPTWNGAWPGGVATVSPVIIGQTRTGDVITVTASGVSAHSNSFDVVWNPAGTVLLDVRPASIAMGRTAHVTATVLDGSGNLDVALKQVTFSADKGVMSPQVATTSSGIATAVFTGTTPGRGVITATLDSGAYGSATVVVQPPVYLPLVMRNYAPGKNLVVSAINASTTPANVSVVIQNTGELRITEDFWVILYLDPTSQVMINKFWWQVGAPNGAAWWITTDMQPGQTLTLLPANATPPYKGYWPTSFSSGQHSLWAQVDGYASSGTTGLVRETNESDNVRSVTFTVP